MNKRVLIVVTGIVACIALLVFFVARKTPVQQTSTNPSSLQYALPNAPEPPPSSLPLAKTTDEVRQNVLNAVMRDVRGNPIIADQTNAQEYFLARENHYSISYFGKYDNFLIQIQALPFDQSRKEAELRFLQIINAPADVACQLNVIVNTTYAVDPDLAGNNFHLSFCK